MGKSSHARKSFQADHKSREHLLNKVLLIFIIFYPKLNFKLLQYIIYKVQENKIKEETVNK